jgi:hypothetical protein
VLIPPSTPLSIFTGASGSPPPTDIGFGFTLGP